MSGCDPLDYIAGRYFGDVDIRQDVWGLLVEQLE